MANRNIFLLVLFVVSSFVSFVLINTVFADEHGINTWLYVIGGVLAVAAGLMYTFGRTKPE